MYILYVIVLAKLSDVEAYQKNTLNHNVKQLKTSLVIIYLTFFWVDSLISSKFVRKRNLVQC
jgi:hypothetical protein